MICVVCREHLLALFDGQYAHEHCQKSPDWRAAVRALDFAVDEAISTGEISGRTQNAMREEIGRDFDAAVAKLEPPS